jgi:regulatory helix-turn-helix LysR family protein
MINEHVTVETGDTKLSRRFSSPLQGHLRSLEKDEAKKCPNYIKAESAHLRMIDLNLFRVFDAMMLHRSVRKASQILSVTPSAVSHALGRLRQSIGDELFIPTESGMQPTRRALTKSSSMAKSQGPVTFVYLSTGVPFLSRNRIEPGSGVPPLLGSWPTTTNPRFSTPSAVVKPPSLG